MAHKMSSFEHHRHSRGFSSSSSCIIPTELQERVGAGRVSIQHCQLMRGSSGKQSTLPVHAPTWTSPSLCSARHRRRTGIPAASWWLSRGTSHPATGAPDQQLKPQSPTSPVAAAQRPPPCPPVWVREPRVSDLRQ